MSKTEITSYFAISNALKKYKMCDTDVDKKDYGDWRAALNFG